MDVTQFYEFDALCKLTKIATPAPITRALELIDAANLHREAVPRKLLDLHDDEILDVVTDLALRGHTGHTDQDQSYQVGSRGLNTGVDQFIADLCTETRAATLPLLDDLVAELRPEFDRLAKPLVAGAQSFDFTYATTSDEIILRADEKASTAWRDARASWNALDRLVKFRIRISQLFEVSPTPAEVAQLRQGDFGKVDYSVCFAAADNWSDKGAYYLEGKPGSALFDWFALGTLGIRLNTPSEVHAKLDHRSRTTHQLALKGEPIAAGVDEVPTGGTYPLSGR